MQIRVARPTARLDETAAFYRDLVGLPVLASFTDHDGFSGVILGVPPSAPANPYWEHDGARCFVDPDGYWLVLSPSEW